MKIKKNPWMSRCVQNYVWYCIYIYIYTLYILVHRLGFHIFQGIYRFYFSKKLKEITWHPGIPVPLWMENCTHESHVSLLYLLQFKPKFSLFGWCSLVLTKPRPMKHRGPTGKMLWVPEEMPLVLVYLWLKDVRQLLGPFLGGEGFGCFFCTSW